MLCFVTTGNCPASLSRSHPQGRLWGPWTHGACWVPSAGPQIYRATGSAHTCAHAATPCLCCSPRIGKRPQGASSLELGDDPLSTGSPDLASALPHLPQPPVASKVRVPAPVCVCALCASTFVHTCACTCVSVCLCVFLDVRTCMPTHVSLCVAACVCGRLHTCLGVRHVWSVPLVPGTGMCLRCSWESLWLPLRPLVAPVSALNMTLAPLSHCPPTPRAGVF